MGGLPPRLGMPYVSGAAQIRPALGLKAWQELAGIMEIDEG